jgi:flagellar motility protein MotE (MotC chaperone)
MLMKTMIIIILLTFIVASGATMFLTGTFRQRSPEEQPSEEGEVATTETAEDTQQQGENTQSQGNGKTNAVAASDSKQAERKALIAEEEKKLAAIKSEIASLTVAKAAVTEAQELQDLAKIYGSMKPDTAASIMLELEEGLTKRILKGMSTKTAGKIMDSIANTDSEYAAKVSKLMAGS